MVALAAATVTLATDLPAPRRPDVDVIVPVDPHEHERLHYFGRRHHHLVPGTVTIDKAPYVCDLDRKKFTDREQFTSHLQRTHKVPPADIPDRLVVEQGVVHFIGE